MTQEDCSAWSWMWNWRKLKLLLHLNFCTDQFNLSYLINIHKTRSKKVYQMRNTKDALNKMIEPCEHEILARIETFLFSDPYMIEWASDFPEAWKHPRFLASWLLVSLKFMSSKYNFSDINFIFPYARIDAELEKFCATTSFGYWPNLNIVFGRDKMEG